MATERSEDHRATSRAKSEELVDHLGGVSSLVIVCHDNPDPDALASALALRRIANTEDVTRTRIVHGGDISHQQNRVFVNLLGLDLDRYQTDVVDSSDSVALVDSPAPGRNNSLPTDADVEIIIDHHVADTPNGPVRDVRDHYSSTTEILVEYLRELELKPSPQLATAMQFAIRQDTNEYLRNMSSNAHESANFLQPLTDMELLRQMAEPPVSETTLDAVGTSIRTRTVRSAYLIANVGRITERDAVPQATDYLLHLEGIKTVLVFGINGKEIHVSARSNDPRVRLGSLLEEIFSDIGDAGGHDGMAAAQLPLGLFGDVSDNEEDLIRIAGNLIEGRFFRAIGHD